MILFVWSIVVVDSVNAQTIGKNYIAIEAENTSSDLGLWKVITPTDSTYFTTNGGVEPINNTYIEFTGNNHNGGDPKSPLEYKFTCPKTGTYRMVMRMYQRLLGLPEDKCNDVWVRMSGDFTSVSENYSTEDLKKDMKFYGRGTETWGVCYKGEGGHHKREAIQYNLKKGEEYVFTMSGRAQRTCIDYILFYDILLPMKIKAFEDLAANNKEKYRPEEFKTNIIKAIDFNTVNIDGFEKAIKDEKKGIEILSVKKPLATAATQTIYKGKSGKAIFKINTMLEVDGEPSYTLKVNGKKVGSVVNDRIHGTSVPDYTIQNHLINGVPVEIKKGDVLQVEFTNATNGLIPEGNSTATARARWVSLEVCMVK